MYNSKSYMNLLVYLLFILLFNTNSFSEDKSVILTKAQKEWIKNHPVISVQSEYDWEPFNYTHDNKPYGHSIDYMKLLASKIGVKIKFIQGHTWKEYLEMLKKGDLDMMVNIAKTPKREQFYSYTSEYHKVLSSLYVHESNKIKYKSLEDFEGKTVSVVQGMVGESVLRKNYPKINIYPVKTSLDAIKAVVYGKADGVIQVNALGNILLNKYNIKNIKPIFEINDPKFNMHLHLATNKDNKILRDILEKGILQITDKERLELQEKYFSTKVQKVIDFTDKEIDWLQNTLKIKIGIPGFQEPLLIKGEKGMEGIFPEFLELISKKLGVELEIELIGSKKNGSKAPSKLGVDAILMINHPNKQKSTSSLFTNQFLSFPMVIASLESSPIFNGLNDNDLKHLAIPAHSPLRGVVKAKYPNIEHITVNGCKEGLNKLLEHKADAYVCNPHVIAYTLRNTGISGVAITSITPYQLGFTLKISNENEILHSILNKTIDSFSSQEIQDIKKHWQQLELQRVPDYTIYFQIIALSLMIAFGVFLWIIWWNRRLKREIKLKEEAERKYKVLLDNVPGMVYRAENKPDWPMIEVNESAFSLTGYTREEFINRSVLYNDIIVKEDRERIWNEVQEAVKSKIPYIVEYKIKTKSGEIKWISEKGEVYYSNNGEMLWLEGLIVDNTMVKENELELTLFKYIVDSSLDYMAYLDSSYRYRAVNQIYMDAYNKKRNEIVGATVSEILGEELFEGFIKEKLDKCLEGEIVVYDNWFEFKQFGKKYMHVTYYPYKDKNKTIGIVVVSKDISKEKLASDALIKTNNFLMESQKNAKIANWTFDPKTGTPWWSEELYNIIGRDPKDGPLPYCEHPKLIHPDDWEFFDATVQNTAKTGQPYNIVHRIIHTDGSVLTVNSICTTLLSDRGDIVNMHGTMQDITQLKEAELKIKQERDQAQMYLDIASVIILILDKDGNIKTINQKGCEILGYEESELIGKHWLTNFLPDQYQEEVVQIFNDICQGVPGSVEINHIKPVVTKSGEWRWISWHNAIVRDKEGNVKNTISSGEDITELKKKDEIMIAQSRHAAMGEMISMIAHQWRQPLSVIAMSSSNILADIDLGCVDNTSLKEESLNIVNQTEELSKTIDDFKNFFRPSKVIERVLPEDIFSEAFKVIGKSLEYNEIEVYTQYGNTQEIETYSRELMQVFINILKNAKEILVEKGIENKKIDISVIYTSDSVNITICDNGGGISSEIVDKVFDPYFSTKDIKSGTGLGLYMSKTIIEKHLKGTISVYNKNEGACFEIKLPLKITNGELP